jgi:hypothetical protein
VFPFQVKSVRKSIPVLESSPSFASGCDSDTSMA